jgi:hypothetical protein
MLTESRGSLFTVSDLLQQTDIPWLDLFCTAEEADDFLIIESTPTQTYFDISVDFDYCSLRLDCVDNMSNIQTIPPSVLKSWPTPNYDDPVRRTWLPIFAMFWQVASTMLVWLRFYLRIRHLAGPFGYDDAFMLVAWVSHRPPLIACIVSDHCLRSR